MHQQNVYMSILIIDYNKLFCGNSLKLNSNNRLPPIGLIHVFLDLTFHFIHSLNWTFKTAC